MEGFEITGPYASALLMSLGAVCVFIWGVLSGAFHRADAGFRSLGVFRQAPRADTPADFQENKHAEK